MSRVRVLGKIVNRILRDAGIVALAGFIFEKLSEDRQYWRFVSVRSDAVVVEYGFPFAVTRMTYSSTSQPQLIAVEFIDKLAIDVVVLGLIVLLFVEAPLISYEIYKWRKEKRKPET